MLPVMQFSPQGRQRAAHQVLRKVGHQAHGMGQVQAVGEGGSALVVDEQEAHPVRAVGRSHAHDPGLQEFRLAGAGGATHQGVRAFVLQVQVQRFDALGSHQGPERAVVLAVCDGGRVDGVVLFPPVRHRLGVVHEVLADEAHVGHRPGKVGVVIHGFAHINDRRQHPGKLGGQVGVEAFAADGVSVAAQPDLAGGGSVVAVHHHEVAARGRERLDAGGHPHDVDARIRSAFHEPCQAAAVHRRVVFHDQQHGGQHRAGDVAFLSVEAGPRRGTR
ncbi:hypothetical protein D9M72_403030 [compost metagenome]